MPDLDHAFGADLAVGPTGDLAMVAGSAETVERLLRRLLTNPRDYLWLPDYGAGLGRFVGQPANGVPVARLKALIRRQVLAEAAVAATPAPTITVTARNDGTVLAAITYTDATTGQTQSVAVPLTGA